MRALSKKEKIIGSVIIIVFILIGVGLRLLPHPPNFVPIVAIALFGGTYLSKKTALTLPMMAMVISDIFIGFYEIKLMVFVYGSFLICVLLGFWLKNHKKWQTVFGGLISCAFIFFLLTNFAVWAFTPWYPKTFLGLIQCYFLAIPFFRNTLLGSLLYGSVFFGAYEVAEFLVRKKIGGCKIYDYKFFPKI
ncbi:hypothetical protein KKB06_02680 [Patescibacteria group bacterium]|nr:hypothetical protein [Patescibacteria group bacterium]